MENLTTSEYLKIWETINPEDVITGTFTDEKSKCCAVGHFTRLTSENPNNYNFWNCTDWSIDYGIREISQEFFQSKGINGKDISSINNKKSDLYPEDSPYERVTSLLQDMIEAGY